MDHGSGGARADWHGWNWRTIGLIVTALLGVGVLAALVVTLGLLTSERDRALARRTHSFEIMILSRTLAGTIARSEASLGRYVISGDRALGQLYYDEWRLAKSQLRRLGQITEAPQQPLLAELRRQFEARGQELSLIALNTNYGKNAQALSRYYRARDASALLGINTALDRVIRQERDNLEIRTEAAREKIAQSATAAKFLSVFGVALMLGAIMLGWMTLRAIGERVAARAEAESQRERAEELTRAVAAATRELRDSETRLRQVQKMEAVGQLTGGIAHDFNNMLAVMIGGMELARRGVSRGAPPAEIGRHVDSAMEGANRAAALTRQLLAFSREAALNPETMSVPSLLDGMALLLERTMGEAMTVVVADRSGGWRLHADRTELENSVLNLALNARDAMGGRGVLTITAATARLTGDEHDCAPGDYLALSITDTGTGIPAHVAERVFEPFFTTKPVGKGTGLGLAQVFGFVRQQGGAVTLDTVPGAGTTVTMYLPRATAPAAAPAAAAPVAAAVVADDAPEPRRLCVMVVEDDPRVLAATTGAIDELGHHAIGCDDPLAVPALLDAHPAVDLILSDVLMPSRTGPEMIASLGPAWDHLAVLFVTGYAGEFAETGSFGGHRVLRKPFTLAALDQAIATAMEADRPRGHERAMRAA